MKATLVITWFLFAVVASREVIFESFHPMAETDKSIFEFGTLRVKKQDRHTFSLAGSFDVKRNLGNEATLSAEIVNTHTHMKLYKFEKPICEFFKTENVYLPELREASNLPGPDACPFPKGNYTINNYNIDEKRFGMAPAGMYEAIVKMMEEGKVFAACKLHITIKP